MSSRRYRRVKSTTLSCVWFFIFFKQFSLSLLFFKYVSFLWKTGSSYKKLEEHIVYDSFPLPLYKKACSGYYICLNAIRKRDWCERETIDCSSSLQGGKLGDKKVSLEKRRLLLIRSSCQIDSVNRCHRLLARTVTVCNSCHQQIRFYSKLSEASQSLRA